MSRWLQNVGNFLETLDGQAERVVEERALQDDDDDGEPLHGGEDSIENILAARGLAGQGDHHDDDDNEDDNFDVDVDVDVDAEAEQQVDVDVDEQAESNNEKLVEPAQQSMEEGQVEPEKIQPTLQPDPEKSAPMDQPTEVEPEQQQQQQQSVPVTEEANDNDPPIESSGSETTITNKASEASKPETDSVSPEMSEEELPVVENTIEEKEEEDTFSTPAKKAPAQEEPPVTPFYTPTKFTEQKPAPKGVPVPPRALPLPDNSQVSEKLESSANAARQAQKENRTLRRHVVTLNKQLETVEAEMLAQRTELEGAAERMEKDRARHKEEREKEKARQVEELKVAKAQHEKALKDMRLRTDQQVEQVQRQLRDLEDQRSQEGGDWNKELADAVRREQEMAGKFALMEDEKGTFLSQIATLQAQQEALGNRLESLTHTADNAMEREREAEDRLDEALSLHARQISQRQAREAELERTISELGAALVAARNKQTAGVAAQSAGDDTGQNSSLVGRLQTLEQETENLHAQLSHEEQRNETLKHELRDVSREYTEEATVIHSRQQQHDRHVAELSQTISKLKLELRESRSDTRKESVSSDLGSEENDDLRQIKSLSEEVLRQREKVGSSSSEISALKSRLKAALDRAANAEDAVEAARNNDGDSVDVERATSGGNGMRRRGGGGSRKSSNTTEGGSIRAALHLDALQGENSERVGKSLDALDKFLVESGKFLRYNPLARLLFIVYLLMLHLWTFLLLFVHAHTFENVHGDFGAGGLQAHGPHALMQEQPTPPADVQMQPPPIP